MVETHFQVMSALWKQTDHWGWAEITIMWLPLTSASITHSMWKGAQILDNFTILTIEVKPWEKSWPMNNKTLIKIYPFN